MVYEKLLEMKKDAHLTNQQVADLSGVPLATVNRILSGQTENPTFDTVVAMAKAMGGSAEELMGISKVEEVETRGYDKLAELHRQHIYQYEEHLKTQREHIKSIKILVRILFCIIAFLLLFEFGYILLDFFTPTGGVIRY